MYPVLSIKAVDTETAIATAAMEIARHFYNEKRYIDDKVLIAATLNRSYLTAFAGSVLDSATGRAWVVVQQGGRNSWSIFCITHP